MQRREAIIAAAQTVFARSGLGGARTAQIADAAGVAESMLYKHFASKRALFDAAVTAPVAKFVQLVADSADGHVILEADSGADEDFYESFLATMMEVLPLLGVALFSDSDDGKRFYRDDILPLLANFQDSVRESLEDVDGGELLDAGLLTRAIIGTVFITTLDIQYRDQDPLDDASKAGLAQEIRSFIARAVGGARVDHVLDLLTRELTREHHEGPTAPVAGLVSVDEQRWTRYWEAVEHREAKMRAEIQELEKERATLREILADQALELQRLRVGDAGRTS